MIIQNIIKNRTFLICCGSCSDANGGNIENTNQLVGSYNQYIYTVLGSGKANNITLTAGELADLSTLKGNTINYTSDGVSAWVTFNPILKNTKLDIEILKEGSHTVQTDSTVYLVPIVGKLVVGDNTIDNLGCGKLTNKQVNINVDVNNVVAVVNVFSTLG